MRPLIPRWHVDQKELREQAKRLQLEDGSAYDKSLYIREAFRQMATVCMLRKRMEHELDLKHRKESLRTHDHRERAIHAQQQHVLSRYYVALQRIQQLQALPDTDREKAATLPIHISVLRLRYDECVRIGIPENVLKDAASYMKAA